MREVMKMIIGCDLDGVITIFSIKIRKKLPWWIFLFLIFMPPCRKIIKLLRKLNQNNQIILISARPKEIKYLTKFYLRWHKIPFEKIYLLGPGKDIEIKKLEVIIKENVELFIDDEEEIRNFLIKFGINTISPRDALLYFAHPFFLTKFDILCIIK